MAFLESFVLSSSNENNCTNIVVYDQTDYSTWVPGVLRSDCGIALFWSTDGFVSDSNGELSNSGDGWNILSESPNTYTIKGYIVPIWSAGAYLINSIVFHENYFYHATAGTSTEPGTGSGAVWTLLDEDDYSTFNTYVGAGSIDYGYTTIIEDLTCSKYTLSKTTCYEYELSFAASAVTKTITITKYDGTAIDGWSNISITAGETTANIDIATWGDGVYIMTIEEAGEDDYNIVIYELCTVLACGTSLLDNLFQADVDPCCDDCDDDITETMWKQRHDLNSMIYYLGYLFAYINVESITYIGYGDVGTTRQGYINRIGDYIDKLLVITDRCGECD